jgi:hypothetical protein
MDLGADGRRFKIRIKKSAFPSVEICVKRFFRLQGVNKKRPSEM